MCGGGDVTLRLLSSRLLFLSLLPLLQSSPLCHNQFYHATPSKLVLSPAEKYRALPTALGARHEDKMERNQSCHAT